MSWWMRLLDWWLRRHRPPEYLSDAWRADHYRHRRADPPPFT